jgi:hypothetical protein
MPRTLGISGAVDMGILLQTVTLLMLDRGIGSIAQGRWPIIPTRCGRWPRSPTTTASCSACRSATKTLTH